MGGTVAGGKQAAKTNLERHGVNFYRTIGSKGGKKGTTGGFYYAKFNLSPDDPAHPKNAGYKGGKLSKRGTK